MTIGQGITVQVAPYDGTNGGSFEVYAEVRLTDYCRHRHGYRQQRGQSVRFVHTLALQAYQLILCKSAVFALAVTYVLQTWSLTLARDYEEY